ncbi:energy transducer TonB [Paucibacter sp. AS339]|uniref:energy transducer TonB n=1 Tax=Paucibacter hankyongi TaxID=3133434 RepID=UPI0030953518
MPTEFAEQGGSDGLDGYVPRPLLTVAPLAHEPVFLQWPESLFEGGEGDPLPGAQFIGVLALFIDEAGWVQTVRVQEGNLAPAMVEAAKRAFQGVRFSAGELNGQVVKSRIYVEVVFDRPDTRPSGRGAVH